MKKTILSILFLISIITMIINANTITTTTQSSIHNKSKAPCGGKCSSGKCATGKCNSGQ
jgi:hypothetical protein